MYKGAYPQFQSEYLKSLFCLVLGFRGDVSMISFLMDEAELLPLGAYNSGIFVRNQYINTGLVVIQKIYVHFTEPG